MTINTTGARHLTQQQLEQTLWKASNALRGPVDPGDFKAYVFPVLFFKWISDNWDFKHTEAVAEWEDDVLTHLKCSRNSPHASTKKCSRNTTHHEGKNLMLNRWDTS